MQLNVFEVDDFMVPGAQKFRLLWVIDSFAIFGLFARRKSDAFQQNVTTEILSLRTARQFPIDVELVNLFKVFRRCQISGEMFSARQIPII